ncbi:hypothetical protein [Flavobacterium sp.]|uniref:hypothetical protein n=1 Tax=Flavobacterium sp. TaxID=239 RepID=UPI002635ECCD|nr:hypothetical protein [Flavobacterium sp.]
MKFFLRLKHWQLFLLQFAIPFCFYIILTFTFIFTRNFTIMFSVFPFLMLVVLFFLHGWIFTSVVNLHRKLPETSSLRLNRFKFFFFFPLVYILALFSLMGIVFSGDLRVFELLPAGAVLLIILIHLFAIFCNFYCLYFFAKSLKSVELQREARFNDYAAEFFLLWFTFVGIWIIQPRINKIFDPSAAAVNHAELGQ